MVIETDSYDDIEDRTIDRFLYLKYIGEKRKSSLDMFSILFNSPRYRDFFDDRILTYKNGDALGTYSFTSSLGYSDWSPGMIHGADMLPGMVEGFQGFLNEQGGKIASISNIRFKEITSGNLLYTIVEKPITDLQNESNVYGEFKDSQGKPYYFYALDTGSLDVPLSTVFINDLCTKLLRIEERGRSKLEDACKRNREKVNIPLPRLSHNDINEYVPKISNNIGYLLATVMDVQTIIRQVRDGSSGLVIGYKDIVWDDSVDPLVLFNGSCSISLEKIGSIKQTSRGYGTASSFALKYGSKDIVKGVCIVSTRS